MRVSMWGQDAIANIRQYGDNAIVFQNELDCLSNFLDNLEMIKTFLLPKTVDVIEKLLHKEKLDDADKNLIKTYFITIIGNK